MIYNKQPIDINEINKLSQTGQVNIELNNTKGITLEQLKNLNLENINITVKGGLNKAKYLGSESVEQNEHYRKRVTYGVEELIMITTKIEAIESQIPFGLDQLETAKYLYETIGRTISTDPNYKSKPGHETQSLKILLNQKGICAGFALLYKELMDRQGIECEYVRGIADGEGKHAWNVLKIDEEYIPVDPTWDSNYLHRNQEMKFLGNSEEFADKHVPDNDEQLLDYHTIPYNKEDINAKKRLELKTRKDGSKFLLEVIGTEQLGRNTVYRYIQSELGAKGEITKPNIIYSENNFNELDDVHKKEFINELLEPNRLARYRDENKGYLGYVAKKDTGTVGKFILRDMPIEQIKPNGKFVRTDGSFINTFKHTEETSDKVASFNTHEFEEENGNYFIKSRKVYSQFDLTNPENHKIADTILSVKTLERRESRKGILPKEIPHLIGERFDAMKSALFGKTQILDPTFATEHSINEK